MSEPRNGGKTVKVSEEQHRRLKAEAALRGMTLEAYLEELLAEALAEGR